MFDWIKIGRLVLVLVFGLFTGSQILAAQLTGNFLRSPIPLDVPLNVPRQAGPVGRDPVPPLRAGSFAVDPAVSSGTVLSGAFHSGVPAGLGRGMAGAALVTSTGRLNMIEPQGLQTHLQLVALPSQDGAPSQMADQAEALSVMATPMDFTIDHADWPQVAVWSERAGASAPATHFQKIAAIDHALDRTVTIGYLPTDPPTVVFVRILVQEEDLP